MLVKNLLSGISFILGVLLTVIGWFDLIAFFKKQPNLFYSAYKLYNTGYSHEINVFLSALLPLIYIMYGGFLLIFSYYLLKQVKLPTLVVGVGAFTYFLISVYFAGLTLSLGFPLSLFTILFCVYFALISFELFKRIDGFIITIMPVGSNSIEQPAGKFLWLTGALLTVVGVSFLLIGVLGSLMSPLSNLGYYSYTVSILGFTLSQSIITVIWLVALILVSIFLISLGRHFLKSSVVQLSKLIALVGWTGFNLMAFILSILAIAYDNSFILNALLACFCSLMSFLIYAIRKNPFIVHLEQ